MTPPNDKQETPEWAIHWEKVNAETTNGVNPHAYRLGFLAGNKQIEQQTPAKTLEEVEDQIEAIFDENLREHKGLSEALLHSKEQIAELLYASQPRKTQVVVTDQEISKEAIKRYETAGKFHIFTEGAKWMREKLTGK